MSALATGSTPPDITLHTDLRGDIPLASFRGAPLVLYFYPRDHTPGCTTEAQDFRDAFDAFQALGAQVIGVSPDPLPSHQRFRDAHALPFPLASDPEHVLATAFGVYREKQQYGRTYMGIVRSTFLLDAEGRVAHVWDNVRVRRKRAGEEIRHVDEVLDALRERG